MNGWRRGALEGTNTRSPQSNKCPDAGAKTRVGQATPQSALWWSASMSSYNEMLSAASASRARHCIQRLVLFTSSGI